MQLKNMNKTRLFKIAAVFTAVVLLTVFASVVASAENVVIKEDKNTSLTFLRLNGKSEYCSGRIDAEVKYRPRCCDRTFCVQTRITVTHGQEL